jgi:hypothetical protein
MSRGTYKYHHHEHNQGLGLKTCSFNPLKPSGDNMYHLLYRSVILHFVFMGLVWSSVQTAIVSLNSVNQLIFVMVKCDVLFEVQTEFLNIIWTSFGSKELNLKVFVFPSSSL